MAPHPVRAIIFDLGRVLLDFDHTLRLSAWPNRAGNPSKRYIIFFLILTSPEDLKLGQ